MQTYQRWIWQAPAWPALDFNAEALQAPLSQARQSVGVLLGKAQAIGLERLQPQMLEAMTQEAMTTSSIEGEKLDPNSVRSSIARRLGLDNLGAPPSERERNIEGLLDVMQDATMNVDAELTMERLCSWHAALFPTGFSGMRRIDVGVLRSQKMEIVSGPIGRQKVHYEAPPAQDIQNQVQRFLDWFNATRPRTGKQPMDGLIRCAISHLWFETLHPFDDGNGRIGRAILQLAIGDDLGQPGRIVTLSRQIESCKNQYYQELENAQKSKHMDVTPWVDWMVRQIKNSADFASKTIDVSLQRIHFQNRMAAFPLNERQLKSMKKLLDAGPNGFIGGMTTKKHQNICQTSTPTAARDLIELESLGLLARQGAGRSTRYYPAIDGWAEDDPRAAVANEALGELLSEDPAFQDEVNSRVEALPRLHQQAGAVYTLHQVASKALQDASGDARGVDWDQVHQDVLAKAVGQNKQAVSSVLKAIKQHSPGAVTPQQIAAVDAMGKSRNDVDRTRSERDAGPLGP